MPKFTAFIKHLSELRSELCAHNLRARAEDDAAITRRPPSAGAGSFTAEDIAAILGNVALEAHGRLVDVERFELEVTPPSDPSASSAKVDLYREVLQAVCRFSGNGNTDIEAASNLAQDALEAHGEFRANDERRVAWTLEDVRDFQK